MFPGSAGLLGCASRTEGFRRRRDRLLRGRPGGSSRDGGTPPTWALRQGLVLLAPFRPGLVRGLRGREHRSVAGAGGRRQVIDVL